SEILVQTLATMFPENPPRFLARTPHGYHDTKLVRTDVERAGFSDVAVQSVAATAYAGSARDAAFALCGGTPMRSEVEERGPGRLDEAVERVTAAYAARFGRGPIAAPISAHVIEAKR